jgi:hypothetical protein
VLARVVNGLGVRSASIHLHDLSDVTIASLGPVEEQHLDRDGGARQCYDVATREIGTTLIIGFSKWRGFSNRVEEGTP